MSIQYNPPKVLCLERIVRGVVVAVAAVVVGGGLYFGGNVAIHAGVKQKDFLDFLWNSVRMK